jgi:hypothetical protein
MLKTVLHLVHKQVQPMQLYLTLFYFGNAEYRGWKQHIIDQFQKTTTQSVVTLPPQVIM